MKKIFILGTSRTGSKFYTQLLNSHKEINISPELIFRHPFKTDLHSYISLQIDSNRPLESIVKSLFKFDERLTFYRTIREIGEELLIEHLSKNKEITPEVIFEGILECHAIVKGKAVSGAKFPVHVTYSKYVLEKLKPHRVIFLTRHPCAVFISDYFKKSRESAYPYYRFPVKGRILRKVVLFYSMYEWAISMKHYENIRKVTPLGFLELFRYEEILSDPDIVLDKLGKLLQIDSKDLNPSLVRQVDSSFGLGLSSDRWKKEISWLELGIIKFFIGKRLAQYGYR